MSFRFLPDIHVAVGESPPKGGARTSKRKQMGHISKGEKRLE